MRVRVSLAAPNVTFSTSIIYIPGCIKYFFGLKIAREIVKIYNNDVEIGKILICDDYPFGLIKFKDENFDREQTFKSNNCSFKVIVPQWLKI